MAELKDIKAAVHPTDTLLVVDAMTGQEAATLVKSFNDQVDISGAILTKMDGDSRGGAALSVREVSCSESGAGANMLGGVSSAVYWRPSLWGCVVSKYLPCAFVWVGG
jgi:hypothetical protein